MRPVIEAHQLTKRFRRGAHRGVFEWIRARRPRFGLGASGGSNDGRCGNDRSEADPGRFEAISGVSFEVEPGEAFGIIGPNGAGKSTMLRLLAGILKPDGGRVRVRGRLAALIEIGAGFHPDLTGRENVYLNGALLGMSRREIRERFDEIESFAGLEAFMDTPVKRYSSGMYARLGFSIAVHTRPEVLLVDEVLSVGDALFRLRCMRRMRELLDGGTALVFITHNLDQMRDICRRTLVLHRGKALFIGPAEEAIGHYYAAMGSASEGRCADVGSGSPGPEETAMGMSMGSSAGISTAPVRVLRAEILDAAGRPTLGLQSGSALEMRAELESDAPYPAVIAEFNLRRATHENVMSLNSGRAGLSLSLRRGANRVELRAPCLPLSGGAYFWSLRFWDEAGGACLVDTPFDRPLHVDDGGRGGGFFCLEQDWHIDDAEWGEMHERDFPLPSCGRSRAIPMGVVG